MRPLAILRHENLADAWADIAQETGAIVRRDVFVLEFSIAKEEAWLDVWAGGLPELSDVLLDVTIRHPRASRYMPTAATQAGSTAAHAEGEKQARYPPASGRSVVALAHETWGRLGASAEAFLVRCATMAARRDHLCGRLPG